MSLRAREVVPCTAPRVRRTWWPGSVGVVDVRSAGVREGCGSEVLSNVRVAGEGEAG